MRRGEPATFDDAPDGAMSLRVIGGGKSLTLAVVNGAATLPATTSQTLPLGRYVSTWAMPDGRQPDGPTFEVEPSIQHGDVQEAPTTHAERVVAALEATMETAAASAELSLSVDGLSLTFEGRADLALELARWRRVLATERGAALPVVG